MHASPSSALLERTRHQARHVALGWGVVLLKCFAVFASAIHFRLALNAWWVVGPLLFLAFFSTGLWVVHRTHRLPN